MHNVIHPLNVAAEICRGWLRRVTGKVMPAVVFATGSLLLGDPSAASAQSSEFSEIPRSLQPGGEVSIVLPPNQPISLTLPLETNRFDSLNPICRFRFEQQRQGRPSSGFCNPPGTKYPVPEYLYFGDLAVDIATHCQWLDDCLVASTQGGSISGQQCNDTFRANLQTQCRRVLSECENVEQNCLQSVSEFANTVAETSEISVSPGPAEPAVQPEASDQQRWVYVGEFRDTWVSRNFEVDAMIAPGDEITASNYVNVRSDHLRLDPQSGSWENAPKLGVLRPGDTVKVSVVEDLGGSGSSAHIWARIE